MRLQKAMYTRHSTRSFNNKKPDWRDILDALDTTRSAPMAGGYFTLKFLIIDDKEKIKKMSKWSEQDFFSEVHYIVAFVSDPKITKNLYKEKGEQYMHQQAGAAIQNFLLSLHEKKLSTCWIGHFNEDKIKTLLGISSSQKLEAFFPIGYEKITPRTRAVQAELYGRINWNTWGEKRMVPGKIVEHYAPHGYK